MNNTLKILTMSTIICAYNTIAGAATWIPCADSDTIPPTMRIPIGCSVAKTLCDSNDPTTPVDLTCDSCITHYAPDCTSKNGQTVCTCTYCLKPCTACGTTVWSNCHSSRSCPLYSVIENKELEYRQNGGTCTGNSCTSNGTCTTPTYEYRCPKGYGRDVTVHPESSDACAKCPDDDSGNTGTSDAGTVFYDDAFYEGCYIAEGATFSDNLGSGIYADDCPYEADSSSS